MADFRSSMHSSIVILSPLNDRAADWLVDHVDDATGGDCVMDGRYFPEIALGLLEDGFTMEDAATGRIASLDGARAAVEGLA